MNIPKNIVIYKSLIERLTPAFQYIEYSSVVRFKEALEWQLKSDSEKNDLRYALAQISEKIGAGIDYYGLGLVEVSKSILEILEYLEGKWLTDVGFDQQDLTLMRLKGILLIEKCYLDEYCEPIRHLHKNFIKRFLDSIKADIVDDSLLKLLNNFESQYEIMFDHWEDAPNEE